LGIDRKENKTEKRLRGRFSLFNIKLVKEKLGLIRRAINSAGKQRSAYEVKFINSACFWVSKINCQQKGYIT